MVCDAIVVTHLPMVTIEQLPMFPFHAVPTHVRNQTSLVSLQRTVRSSPIFSICVLLGGSNGGQPNTTTYDNNNDSLVT